MNTTAIYPDVDEALFAKIVQRICSNGDPQKIILFGSHARGDAAYDSDLDLLVIETSLLPRYKRATSYRRALRGVFPAKDIVVWTPEEISEWQNVPHAFINTALKEGRVLYER